MANATTKHLAEELEAQFHAIQSKIGRAKDSYLAKHHKDYDRAKASVQAARNKLAQAQAKLRKTTEQATKSSSDTAQNQLKKAGAALQVVRASLSEAREIMATAEEKLDSAKPFEKKLAARAKALAAFERDWEKKLKAAEKAKAQRAAARKKAAREKAKLKTKGSAGTS